MNWEKQLRQLLRFLGVIARPKPVPSEPAPPPPPPTPAPEPEPPPVVSPVPRRWLDAHARLGLYRGHLCNLRDSYRNPDGGAHDDKLGRVIWTPALPGATTEVRREWLAILQAAGATHVPIGPFEPGPVYPGVRWSNPDLQADADGIRALLVEILDAGMIPVVFLDSGGRDPLPRIRRVYPVIRAALEGLERHVMTVLAWEPVVGDWRSYELSEAAKLWHRLAPEFLVGFHGSPGRLVGSSNPVERDDPWRFWIWPQQHPNGDVVVDEKGRTQWHEGRVYGDAAEADKALHTHPLSHWGATESGFYKMAGGEWFSFALYQTPHGRDIYQDCDPNDERCWLDRWRDYVTRIGGGLNGWRAMPLVLWETTAYEYMRGQSDEHDARVLASRAKRIADEAGVTVGYGNGFPLGMD